MSSAPECEPRGPQSLSTAPAPSRFAPADAMRVAAMFAVVLLHVSGAVVGRRASMPATDWWVAVVINSACRWCVPLFVMVSGALLLDPARREPLATFYRKRFLRVGIPLVFWTVFYLAATGLFGQARFSVGHAIERALGGEAFLGQYFLLLIVGLYAFVPFLRVFTAHAARHEQLLAWIFCLVAAIGAIAIDVTRDQEPSNAFSWFAPYVGYFLAGHYLRQLEIQRRHAVVAGLIFVAMVLITAVSTGLLTDAEGMPAGKTFYLNLYLSPTVVPMTLSAFVVLMYVARTDTGRLAGVMRTLAPCTFGVFLVHPLLLILLYKLRMLPLPSQPALGILLWTPVLFFVSAALTWVIQRIPVLRYVVG